MKKNIKIKEEQILLDSTEEDLKRMEEKYKNLKENRKYESKSKIN